ncbi:MAG: hypothetical protein MR648_04970 [Clostridiales bacterium]|nr:hypothetical protein [Clostridiales bacterium]MDY4180974.1 hypothetical protein [Pseudoflavonifractor sp.]
MKSYFFNAVKTADLDTYPSGYDREYDADDQAAFFAPFFNEAGVFAGTNANACKVQVQSGLTLAVAAGAVFIRGRMAVFDGSETITASKSCRIVARMDKSLAVRDFQLLAVDELTRTEDVYDLELASVSVSGGAATVTDTRTFLSYMGQPAYYPPTSDDLPYVLWLYTLGYPMTDEQRTMVEGNPSLMEIYRASIGAARVKDDERAAWNGKLDRGGGTMTGAVTFPAGANPALMFNGPVATLAKVSADEDNSILFRSSVLSDEKAALMLILRKDGANTTHYLYGTHNKPSPSDIGAAQMINGSYVGTGTYGEDNPCTITTPFAPKLVIVQDSEWANNMVFVRPHTLALCPDYSSTNGKCTVTWSDAGLSWYNGNKDGTKTMRQFNDDGKTYYYTAIG